MVAAIQEIPELEPIQYLNYFEWDTEPNSETRGKVWSGSF